MVRKVLFVSLITLSVIGTVIACSIDNQTESLPLFYVGTPASVQIQACCGTPPYTFTVYSGTLPPGMSMSSSGLISGTPTAAHGDTFCITITDSVGCHLTYCYWAEAD